MCGGDGTRLLGLQFFFFGSLNRRIAGFFRGREYVVSKLTVVHASEAKPPVALSTAEQNASCQIQPPPGKRGRTDRELLCRAAPPEVP